jgi:excisionase family DNA binding protein
MSTAIDRLDDMAVRIRRHRVLSGETLSLEGLGSRELAFLEDLRRMARAGVSFFEIERAAIGPGSPALRGWSRLTREIADSVLYRVASDIAARAGIAEGLILAPQHEGRRPEIPADRSQLSVTQAATLLGVSRAAIHKAIHAGHLRAARYGNVVLVDREGVLRRRRDREANRRRRSRHRSRAA